MKGAPLAIAGRTDRLLIKPSTPLDGAPPSIEAEWRPVRVVFAARAPGPYLLAVGHRDAPLGPRLEHARSVLAADDHAGARLPMATVEVVAGTGTATAAACAAHCE